MTPESANLSHTMQYCTITMRTDINGTKPFSIAYVTRTEACKYSSLPHLHDKLEIAQNCPNSIQVTWCNHICSKFSVYFR